MRIISTYDILKYPVKIVAKNAQRGRPEGTEANNAKKPADRVYCFLRFLPPPPIRRGEMGASKRNPENRLKVGYRWR